MNFDTKASTIIFVIIQMKVISRQNVFSTHLCLLEWKTYGCGHNQSFKWAKKGVEWWKKNSKLNKYLCIAIKNHGNHDKLLLFHSNECQGIQTTNPFDKILSLSFNFGPLKTYCIRRNQFCKGLLKGLI